MNMGYNNDIEDHYEVPILAKLLHALPHYNITFHRTNNTFRPTDEIYLEVNLIDGRPIGGFRCFGVTLGRG